MCVRRALAQQNVPGARPDKVAQLDPGRVADDLATRCSSRIERSEEQDCRCAKYYHGEQDKYSELCREQHADHEAKGDKHDHRNHPVERNVLH